MCVAIGIPTSVPWIKIEPKLSLAMNFNPDGAGLAWLTPQGVQWVKGLETIESVHKAWQLAEFYYPRLFHARIATVGTGSKALTHPFPVTNKVGTQLSGIARSVLAHNGHWSGWNVVELGILASGRKLPPGEWSDSRLMAFLVRHIGKGVMDTIPDQKVAILNSTGLHYFGKPWYDDTDTGSKLSNDQILNWGHYNYEDYMSGECTNGWQGHFKAKTYHPKVKMGDKGKSGHPDTKLRKMGDKFYSASGQVWYWDSATGGWRSKSVAQYVSDGGYAGRKALESDLLTAKELRDLEKYGATVVGDDPSVDNVSLDPDIPPDEGYAGMWGSGTDGNYE